MDIIQELYKLADEKYADFLSNLPHKYYDECITEVDKFLPYVDNWAVCDIMSPKCFNKNKERLITKITEWSGSDAVYTSRFGIKMLMLHYLDGDFRAEYLEIPARVRLEGYYARMMVAWF